MTIRCRFILTAVIVSSAAAIPACYTIMDHPRLASLDYARPDDNRCSNCHSNEEIWAFNNPSKKPTHESYSWAWIKYYDTAWWYDKKWEFQPEGDKESNQDDNTSNDER
jgi:hypothetical protein